MKQQGKPRTFCQISSIRLKHPGFTDQFVSTVQRRVPPVALTGGWSTRQFSRAVCPSRQQIHYLTYISVVLFQIRVISPTASSRPVKEFPKLSSTITVSN